MNVLSSNPLVKLYSDINDPLSFGTLFFSPFLFSRDISMAAGSKIGINTHEIHTDYARESLTLNYISVPSLSVSCSS